MATEAFEEGAGIIDAGGRGRGSKTIDIIKLGGNTFEVLDDLVNHLNEPTGCGAATLGHDEPLEEAGGVQDTVRGVVSLSMVTWWNDDTRSNRERMRPLPRESSTWSTRGMGSCPSELMALSFL